MSRQQTYLTYKPDYELDRAKIENFIRNYVDKSLDLDPLHGQKKYMIQLVKIV